MNHTANFHLLETAQQYANRDNLCIGTMITRDEKNIRVISNELRLLPYSNVSLSGDFLPDVDGMCTVFIYLVDGNLSITCKWDTHSYKNLNYRNAARFILDDRTNVRISKSAVKLLERKQSYALLQLIKHYGEVY